MELIAIVLSNAIWLCAFCYVTRLQKQERDELTKKIMSDSLSEYQVLTQPTVVEEVEELSEKQKEEKLIADGWVPLAEVEKQPHLLSQFQDFISKHYNNN